MKAFAHLLLDQLFRGQQFFKDLNQINGPSQEVFILFPVQLFDFILLDSRKEE